VYRSLAVSVVALLVVASGCGGDDRPTAPGTPGPEAVTSPVEPTTPAAPTDPGPPTPTDPQCEDEPCYGEVVHLGTLTHDVVEQVSGMAASHRHPMLYYVVSDVPGTSEVAVIEEDGTLVAHIEIEGMSTRDAEALAVGPCGPQVPETCLYVGDIGNHVGLEDLFVYRMIEPDLADPPPSAPADRIRYTYPDDPTDAEALLVDHLGRPLIISKARFDSDTGVTGATRLYRGDADGGVLEDLGEIELPEPENAMFATLVGHVVTGADAADGRVLLRTYDEVYEYRADSPDADLATFPDWPVRRVPAPFQVQSETVAYRLAGCGYITTSELTGSIDAVSCR
jgi:hypothetical protein